MEDYEAKPPKDANNFFLSDCKSRLEFAQQLRAWIRMEGQRPRPVYEL